MPRFPSLLPILKKLDRLSLQDLEQLVDYAQALLESKQQESQELPRLTPDPAHGWREEYRKCGKQNCWCADGKKAHGPYWYRTVRRDGRVVKEYLGKRRRTPSAKSAADFQPSSDISQDESAAGDR